MMLVWWRDSGFSGWHHKGRAVYKSDEWYIQNRDSGKVPGYLLPNPFMRTNPVP